MLVRLTKGYIVTVNGEEIEAEGDTVADALRAAGIEADGNDSITPEITSELYSGMEISYKEGFAVKMQNGSFIADTSTFALTVGEFLEEREITLGESDTLTPIADTAIYDGIEITVNRVYTLTETENEYIPYETEYETSIECIRGKTKVKTEGEEGVEEVTYTCVYENGVLVSKEEIGRTVVKEPVNEVILKGSTGDYQNEVAAVAVNSTEGSNYFIDSDGNKVYYKSSITGETTAYCIPGGITSIGLPVARGVVAVDPDIIPYGSLLYITSDSYTYGYAVAGDTGGAMLSGRVLADLYMESLGECYQFGRRDMTIYIIG